MTEYPSALAPRPAEEAARLVALTQLDAARVARRRLADPSDTEALHDLRVALRRLRTTVRGFRPQLDAAVPRKLRRRLRDLARATGAARDSEVQLAWLAQAGDRLPRGARTGVPWLVARLTARREAAYDTLRRAVPEEFDRLDRRLRESLGRPPRARAGKPGRKTATFGELAATLVREHAAALARHLDLIRSTGDADDVHATRIQSKRLRYLLEPLAAEAAPAADAVAELRRLQDELGELHDLHVLIAELGDASAEAAAERARALHNVALGRGPARASPARRPRAASAGPLRLARIAGEAEQRLLERVVAEWLTQERGAKLLRAVAVVGDQLSVLPPEPLPRPAAPVPTPSLPIRYTRRARS